MATMKRAFELKSTGKTFDVTEENFAELSLANQVLTNICRANDIEVKLAEYEGRKYLNRDTILALDNKLFG
jgi:hypothetical protein